MGAVNDANPGIVGRTIPIRVVPSRRAASPGRSGDGACTDVTAVPEPANVALLLAGLGLLGGAARRHEASMQA